MSRRGNRWDNAPMERFLEALKRSGWRRYDTLVLYRLYLYFMKRITQ